MTDAPPPLPLRPAPCAVFKTGFFSQFGRLLRVRVSRSKKTGKAKHYAFLEFQHPDVAAIAADTMDGYFLFKQVGWLLTDLPFFRPTHPFPPPPHWWHAVLVLWQQCAMLLWTDLPSALRGSQFPS